MSYSFNTKGANKTEAIGSVKDAMANVVAGQPVHARDQEQAIAAADAMVSLLHDDPAKDVYVTVSGSLGWDRGPAGEEQFTSANVQVSAYLRKRESI